MLRIAAIIGRAFDAYKAHMRFRRGYRELAALDDRQLNDIGISRAMIRTVAITGAGRVAEIDAAAFGRARTAA